MTAPAGVRAEIVVSGRDVEVPEHYRVHVAEKMAHLVRYDGSIGRYEVQLFHERNPRQAKLAQRVEITARGAGPVVRAEASAPDFYGALAAALARLETRLRRGHDRRRVHHGLRTPTSVTEATAHLGAPVPGAPDVVDPDPVVEHPVADHSGPLIVREKEFPAEQATVDQAVHAMELVGHDFYLFIDSCTGLPSVVYRRAVVDYGVIRLR